MLSKLVYVHNYLKYNILQMPSFEFEGVQINCIVFVMKKKRVIVRGLQVLNLEFDFHHCYFLSSSNNTIKNKNKNEKLDT